MKLRYVTVDVFTDRPFGGNQLAVVLDADALSSKQMQSIACEFNYAETSFVLPPKNPGHTAHVRIFTPRVEVPFAGHPNVGTAFVVANLNSRTPNNGRLVFEEAAGLVRIDIISSEGKIVGAELTAPEPLKCGSSIPVETVAKCLTIEPADIRIDRHSPQVLSVGLPFLVVELSSRDALRRAKANLAEFTEALPPHGTDAIYLYTCDLSPTESSCDFSARMFAPMDGIIEDPATGSATAAVAALLAEKSPDRTAEFKMCFMQGIDMGRPSALNTRVHKRDGKLQSVHVGGRCVQMMEGTLEIN